MKKNNSFSFSHVSFEGNFLVLWTLIFILAHIYFHDGIIWSDKKTKQNQKKTPKNPTLCQFLMLMFSLKIQFIFSDFSSTVNKYGRK